ncbi:MAG: twin-arginine translocation signal domain-containing protein [Maribacter sp.]|nr:twin-arginine translocation signal domain-containing protein [Maribacter sp.]
MESQQTTERRRFLKTTGIFGAGLLLPNLSQAGSTLSKVDGNIHQFGKGKVTPIRSAFWYL